MDLSLVLLGRLSRSSIINVVPTLEVVIVRYGLGQEGGSMVVGEGVGG